MFLRFAAFFMAAFVAATASAEGPPGQAAAGARDAGGLVRLLKSPDGRLRSQARFELIGMGAGAVPELIKALERRDCVAEAAYVLNAIKDERAAGPLAALLDVPDGEALKKVKTALFSLGGASAPFLLKAAGDPARRDAAAEVLSLLKDGGHIQELKGFMRSGDPALRQFAARVMRSWLDKGAAVEMGGLLTDESARTRRDASAYFLALSPDAPVPHLRDLLKDGDAEVRLNALRAALRERRPELAGALAEVLAGDPEPEARRLSEDALYRCSPGAAVPFFIKALGDKDDSVVAAAASYLGMLRAKEAAPRLVALVTGRGGRPSDAVVESVAGSLAALGADFDPDIFLPCTNWENLYVVRSVLAAWESSAKPGDAGIKEALEKYIGMQVDGRYKERARRLLDRL